MHVRENKQRVCGSSSTGALPVHGCASDLASLIQSRALWFLLLRLLDGVPARGCGLLQESPEAPSPPGAEIMLDRRTHAAEPLCWKFSAIAAFCGCPSFPFPPLRSSSAFFFSLDSGSLSVTSSSFSCSPSLSSALSELRGGGGRAAVGGAV